MRKKLRFLISAALTFFMVAPAYAAGSGMPWEEPLQRILESVQGPVAKIVAVIIIIVTGLTLAFGETSGGFRRLIQIVFGLSIAFADGRQGRHFESRYHLTLLYMPPPDAQARTEMALLDSDRKGEEDDGTRNWRQQQARFRDEAERVLDLLSGFLPEIRALGDAETLTFLHGGISVKRHPVAVPETPMYLDGVLADTPLTGGLEPMLGNWHLRTLTILGFPNATRPGILDALNHQDFAYRWVTRFIPLDKTAATKVLTRLRRQWFAKRKSIAPPPL